MTQTFYSNGKLLLTGEYLVMDGATGLAIPTKYGQSLEVKPSAEKGLHWKSFDHEGNVWFEHTFHSVHAVDSKVSNLIALKLAEILRTAAELNPNFLTKTVGVEVETKLDFPRDWGLGSSSTLINNIAQWADVDAFELLNKSFGGSGYDIAAAQNDGPILFALDQGEPTVRSVALDWGFKGNLFFVHLNKKQDSKEGIARYKDRKKDLNVPLVAFQKLTDGIVHASSLAAFEALLQRHEAIVMTHIGIEPIKQRLFPAYSGMIKSLGAWGGDFVLATGTDEQMDYFRKKGYTTIIPFSEMIK